MTVVIACAVEVGLVCAISGAKTEVVVHVGRVFQRGDEAVVVVTVDFFRCTRVNVGVVVVAVGAVCHVTLRLPLAAVGGIVGIAVGVFVQVTIIGDVAFFIDLAITVVIDGVADIRASGVEAASESSQSPFSSAYPLGAEQACVAPTPLEASP